MNNIQMLLLSPAAVVLGQREVSGIASLLSEPRRRSVALALAGAVLACAGTGAQATEAVVSTGDIAGVGLYGAPAIVVHRQLTTYAKETTGGWHYHPGYVYNVVTAGTIAVQDGCDTEPKLYSAGQAFETSEGRVHRAFVPKESGKDTGKSDAVEQNMFILPAGLRNAEGKPILGRSVPDSMGHCGPPSNGGECGSGGWQKFDFPQKFASEASCAAYVTGRPRMVLLLPADPLK
jgi:quercetin dioxygenase-like cupin family protein